MREVSDTIPGRRAAHAIGPVLALWAALFLGACSFGMNGADDALSVEERYPIRLDPVIEQVSVEVRPETVSVSDADKERVRTLIADYKRRGSGPMAITAPSGTPNAGAAIGAVAELGTLLVEQGISPRGYKVIAYRPADLNSSPPVTVAYPRLEPSVRECGDWSANYAFTPRNRQTPNFGCATQNNIAALLANPQDLVEPRASEPAYAGRRDTVLDNYRQGKPTATERTNDESGEVSSVARQ
ncbi:MAG: CpaD family pilus assembly protein [Alphaproteobacteria bacterium]|nr:CpaD family pilus assembly protein [Alphaproteobacteria bacterium]